MRWRTPFGLGTWVKPPPLDDEQGYGAHPVRNRATARDYDMPAAATTIHGSADDDAFAIRPFRPRLLGSMGGGVDDVPYGYIPSIGPLHGPHFRIGYQGYVGINAIAPEAYVSQGAESDATIGMPTRMRPPLIPRRNASPNGVRDAILFVAAQPNNWPVIQPTTVRR